jgi:hypothetical protein
MPYKDQRMAKLSARISHEAWLQLKQMSHHPKFGELLTYLEAVEGTIGDADLQAAQKLLDGDRNQS